VFLDNKELDHCLLHAGTGRDSDSGKPQLESKHLTSSSYFQRGKQYGKGLWIL